MITEAEYDRVQTLLGRNGNPRPRMHGIFPFTGLIRCGECDGMVTAEEKHQLICGGCRFKFAYRQAKACPRCRTPRHPLRIRPRLEPTVLTRARQLDKGVVVAVLALALYGLATLYSAGQTDVPTFVATIWHREDNEDAEVLLPTSYVKDYRQRMRDALRSIASFEAREISSPLLTLS